MATRIAIAATLVCAVSSSLFAQQPGSPTPPAPVNRTAEAPVKPVNQTAEAQVKPAAGAAGAAASSAKPGGGTSPAASSTDAAVATPPVLPKGIEVPAGFVLGVEDVFFVVFWKDEEMSREVSIRPDGKVSLPLLNDVVANGLTPEQLRLTIQEGAKEFVEDPTVSIVMKAINSRKVYIDGQVGKRGPFPLLSRMTITQLIATAGGTAEYANIKKISVVRDVNGTRVRIPFNYKDYMNGKKLESDIELLPGDMVIVP